MNKVLTDMTLMEAFEEIADKYVTITRKEVEFLYNDPRRKYHNLDHLERMWDAHNWVLENHGDGNNYLANNEHSLILAIVFHDIIYTPGAEFGCNEKHSADFFRGVFSDQTRVYDNYMYTLVRNMIMATMHFDNETYCNLGRYICNLDLADFADYKQMKLNDTRIQDELGLDNETYKRGRYNFFKKLKDRGFILYDMYDFENEKAMANVEKEIIKMELTIPEISSESTIDEVIRKMIANHRDDVDSVPSSNMIYAKIRNSIMEWVINPRIVTLLREEAKKPQ